MTVKNILLFTLWITLSSVALIGGAAEKWWLVIAVVPCFMMWVLYLLVQNEKEKFAHRATYRAFIEARKEIEHYKILQVPRLSLISRQRP